MVITMATWNPKRNNFTLCCFFLALLLEPQTILSSGYKGRVLRGSIDGQEKKVSGNRTLKQKMVANKKRNSKKRQISKIATSTRPVPKPSPVQSSTIPVVLPAQPTPSPIPALGSTTPGVLPSPSATNAIPVAGSVTPVVPPTPPTPSPFANLFTAAPAPVAPNLLTASPIPFAIGPRIPVVSRTETEPSGGEGPSGTMTDSSTSEESSSGSTSSTTWGFAWDSACPEEASQLEKCIGSGKITIDDCKSCIVSASFMSSTDYMMKACKTQFCNGCDGGQYLDCAQAANIQKFPVVNGGATLIREKELPEDGSD
ncbi:unnamed protein product [Pseudo-nitzschia multistriata]|uniref:ShKT domain-containing protein n=1 Tax=Pseudo-nitzschia multistriata TaxID=183589 RepID=A0A448Z4S4_9STRA|nr:unnamed protein product [Pseudo-nitzschia multistriata]